MTGLRYDPSDSDLSDVDLHGSVVPITAKGRREMVLPIGKKTARDIDRYLRVHATHPKTRTHGCGQARRSVSPQAPSNR
jgi:site-specific recombinase XerC